MIEFMVKFYAFKINHILKVKFKLENLKIKKNLHVKYFLIIVKHL